MGLSDNGFFQKTDFEKQARFVGEFLTGSSPMRILEVGAGRLANTKLLAKKFPQHQFTALDLPDRNFLKNRVPGNVTLVEGDYNDLSAFQNTAFDIVFGVETVCHADSKERVLGEISKVLKPGGKLILFDVYEPKPHEAMTDFEKRVSAITLAAMRVTAKDQYIGDTTRYLEQHQFTDIEVTEMTQAIREYRAHVPPCSPFVKKVTEYIILNYNSELSLSSLAEKFGISPSYLSHIFKREINKGVKEFIEEIRISNACRFIESTDMSITQVGYSVGYLDSNYFTKVFKKIMNMTPREYRERSVHL